MSMIELNQVSRYYGNVAAVRQVSFSIKAGEIVGLLGPNGAGKSTIMKMISGLLEPSQGTIKVNGVSLTDQKTRHAVSLTQTQLGYLPEASPTYPEMTVMDYFYFVAKMRNIALAQQAEAIARVIQLTDLSKVLWQPIRTLSRGYRQRVGIAQSIMHYPKVLILDEPTNALDPSQTLAMRQLIRHLATASHEQQAVTVILSTHILQEVDALCDRVLFLQQGALVYDANLSDQEGELPELIVLCNAPPSDFHTVLAEILPTLKSEHTTTAEGHYRYLLRLESPETRYENAQAITRHLVQSNISVYQSVFAVQNLDRLYRRILHVES